MPNFDEFLAEVVKKGCLALLPLLILIVVQDKGLLNAEHIGTIPARVIFLGAAVSTVFLVRFLAKPGLRLIAWLSGTFILDLVVRISKIGPFS